MCMSYISTMSVVMPGKLVEAPVKELLLVSTNPWWLEFFVSLENICCPFLWWNYLCCYFLSKIHFTPRGMVDDKILVSLGSISLLFLVCCSWSKWNKVTCFFPLGKERGWWRDARVQHNERAMEKTPTQGTVQIDEKSQARGDEKNMPVDSENADKGEREPLKPSHPHRRLLRSERTGERDRHNAQNRQTRKSTRRQ